MKTPQSGPSEYEKNANQKANRKLIPEHHSSLVYLVLTEYQYGSYAINNVQRQLWVKAVALLLNADTVSRGRWETRFNHPDQKAVLHSPDACLIKRNAVILNSEVINLALIKRAMCDFNRSHQISASLLYSQFIIILPRSPNNSV
jgi:hypothetical protein